MSNQKSELLAWAASKISAAQKSEIYGTVTLYLERGTITRCQTTAQEKPFKHKESKGAPSIS